MAIREGTWDFTDPANKDVVLGVLARGDRELAGSFRSLFLRI
ncbi:MAG: hypothetical protein ACRDY4_00530 [Acidimicrobiia bacterium]